MNIKELYQEIILEHGKNPRNLRKTENFNKEAIGKNPLCGDNVHIFLKLDENKKVEDISFELITDAFKNCISPFKRETQEVVLVKKEV